MRIRLFSLVLFLLGMEGMAFAQALPEESSPPLIPVPPEEQILPAKEDEPPLPASTPPDPVPVMSAQPPAPPKKPASRIFSVLLAAGPTLQSLVGIPMYGADVSLFLGAQFPGVAIYGGLNSFFGQSGHGLAISHIRASFHGHVRLQRFRLGGGIEQGFFVVNRHTTGASMFTLTMGAHLSAYVDIVQGDISTLFVGLRPFSHLVLGSDSGLFGGTLQLGCTL